MSNLDQKIENAANKIEVAANKAWKKRSFRIVSKICICCGRNRTDDRGGTFIRKRVQICRYLPVWFGCGGAYLRFSF